MRRAWQTACCRIVYGQKKSASLFRYTYKDEKSVKKELEEVNRLLNERGVFVEALLWKENAVLIYTYRLSQLQKELKKPGAGELLCQYGYEEHDVENCLLQLKKKLYNDTSFPHEIGIFLCYPPEDVKGFIENGGQNCKCCGFWKVYCNERETRKLFHKLKKCTDVYLQVFSEGRNLVQMTVCA